ncbi:MAG: hypothetical protein ACLFS7_10375 [Desulfosudaceae bacterium]
MTSCFRTVTAAFIVLILLSTPLWAQEFQAELGVGAHTVRGDFQVETDMDRATMYAGGGVIYDEDDYALFNLKSGLKQSIFAPALTFGLGFKGVAGEYETSHTDFDVYALGFSLLGQCDLARTQAAVPLTLYSDLNVAPDPLCFDDCSDYLEFNAGVEFNLIENGAIFLQYTRLETELDYRGHGHDVSDDIIQVGFRFRFGY